MKTCCNRKWPFYALVIGLVFYVSNCCAQLNIGRVDAGPYTPGSTIAATFTIGTSSCIATNNRFEMYLSDAAGSFSTEKLIGSYTGFYTTYVNGVIPVGTPGGVNYKIRIKSTNPVLLSTESAAFEIKAGTAVEAKITSTYLNTTNTETFGTCISRADNPFFLKNESTASSTVSATITDGASGGGSSTINFTTPNQSFTAQQTHYTIFSRAAIPDGSIATKAYLLVNNKAITAFGTSGNNLVCLPLGLLEFNVDFTSPTGIQNNFPGDLYTITWGDGTTSVYTICDIIQNGGKVQHPYQRSSCGSTSTTSAGTVYNAFAVSINVGNNFCGTIGTPVSSYAKVVVKPINAFSFTSPGCTNTNVTFTNTSVLGEDPNTNTPACAPNTVTYNWYVDGAVVEVNQPRSFNFVYKFATRGEHTIRLESRSSGACDADPVEMKICIQDPPKPAFTLPVTTICAGSTLKPTDGSVIDNICDGGNTYRWEVSPAVTYANGTNATSKEPEFRFANAGTYTVRLAITTPSCGLVYSAPQTVVVNATPTASLSPNISLCNLSVYDFNPTTTGPTKTTLTGTTSVKADTYLWTVSGGAFSFANGTTAASQYPSIKFEAYGVYTVSVTHTNNCGVATASQTLTFITSPVVNAGADQTICYNVPNFLLGAAITGTVQNFTWIGGNGIFAPNRNTLNATYTPTVAERNSGSVNLVLRAVTGLSGTCAQVDDEVVLKILPNVTISSAASKNICTGAAVAYTPTSTPVGATFSWVATGSANASGFSTSGTGNITDVLTNNDPNADATVTYTIIPRLNDCDGAPFNFVVTVKPIPVVTLNATNTTICNRTVAGISFTTNSTNTNYTFTSTASAGISGNTNQTNATAITGINDILVNSGTTTGTVIYTVTPVSTAGCSGTPVSITLNVQPSVTQAIAGADIEICNATSYPLLANTAEVGAGKWSVVSAPTPVTFADDAQPETNISGLVPGNVYILRWTISDSGCSVSSDDIQLTVNPETVAGITAGTVNVCAGTNTGNITLIGQVGRIIRWERSVDNGQNWATITSTSNPYVYTNLTETTQFRAVVQSGICAEQISTVSIVTVNPVTVVANAGQNQSLCSGNGITLSGNNPMPNTGLWTLVSGQADVVITDPALYNTSVTGLQPGQTYRFRWTISGVAPCPPTTSEVTITYFPPVINTISAPETTICNGQNITISGGTPSGGTGTFTFQWQRSADGDVWTNIPSATNKDLTLPLTASTYFRRLVNSTICTSISNSVQITVLPTLTGNTISADQTICLGSVTAEITGSTPVGGDGTFRYQWQTSNNGTTFTDILGASAINYLPAAPTATQFFRRVVSSGTCAVIISNVVKITVNLPAKAEISTQLGKGCAPFQLSASNVSAIPYPDRNGTYTWFANNVQIGSGLSFPGYTISNPNETVTIKLVVSSSLNCNSDETSITFSTYPTVVANFTQSATEVCGTTAIQFTNTSNSLTDATFKWTFGTVGTSNLAQPAAITFPADPTGKDALYEITLEATTPCGITTKTSTVLIKGTPVSVFSPDKTTGCSPLTVNFSNTSPASSRTTYTYDFGDGSAPLTTTDKSSVSHLFTTNIVRNYMVTMTATNDCGSSTSNYNVTVSPNNIVPELVINSNEHRGCAPFTVNLINNTSGATTFLYTFTNEDTGDISTVLSNSAPSTLPYTFTKAGRYTIKLDVRNDCSANSTTETIEVLAQPTVAFTADKTTGCDGLVVKFKNNSVGGVAYVWDFGDGSATSNEFEPQHTFTGPGKKYTVTLKATNILGCINTVSVANYIDVVLPPVAAFKANPGNEQSIPNFTFRFQDTSIDAVSWEWTFGDGTKSTLQNPTHVYANEGAYTVTLKVLNRTGCSATTFQSVRIIGVPGFLNLPNSFMPASAKNEIKTFKAKGKGIQSWDMKIFNKWGQILWQTTALDDGAPSESWDGTYKGQDQPQGVYYWKIEVKFINGSDWQGMSYDASVPKKTGVIYLIR